MLQRRAWAALLAGCCLPEDNERAETQSDDDSACSPRMRRVAQRNLPLPRLIVIDSPMKNITPDINPEIFENFYNELYRLLEGDLKAWQCIVIDQTLFEPPPTLEEHFERLLTKNDPDQPPLISYYHGH